MDNLQIYLTQTAAKSFIKDLKANGCIYKQTSKTGFIVSDTPKIRTAILLVKERFGTRSIIVNNSK
jgi:hypothetical protein